MTSYVSVPAGNAYAVRYNEKKVGLGRAELIYAGNFLKDAEALSRKDKWQRFSRQEALNLRVGKKRMQLVLSFHPLDNLNRDKLTLIAVEFMDQIGFGGQPYLVYQHLDAGRPHCHVVTSFIRPDGSALRRLNLQSPVIKNTCRKLELKFKLRHTVIDRQVTRPVASTDPPASIDYGISPTAGMISRVVDYVISHYRFTCMLELNSILHFYHLAAMSGRPGSRMYERRGLVYQVLDEKGKSRSAPVNASSLAGKPMLGRLEEIFAQNSVNWQVDITMIRLKMQELFRREHSGWTSFARQAKNLGLEVLPFAEATGALADLVILDKKGLIAVRSATLGFAFEIPELVRRLGLPDRPVTKPLIGYGRDIVRAFGILETHERTRKQELPEHQPALVPDRTHTKKHHHR